uniref:Penicillin-binding protein activator LpoA n=1 Tax=Candidatus Methanophaga sp. ANME-1 ERB7 TaxID=2759913 RepID=A0A7G9Z1Q1_9EURY|nr:penicillin-binding protein activator LpoA [Methanosarcinales archaeon ANME-1 ERB7]
MALTTKAIAVIAVILLVVGFAAGWFLRTPAPEVAPQPEVVFGALLSLTGSASSVGESSEAGLELAVEDVNEYLLSIGSKTRIRVIVEDTKTDPAVALEKLQSLAGKGVRVVIGPVCSAEVETIKAYAEENGILLVSASSIAPSLAIPGDNVFRFCPDATHQAEAVARLMWEDGVRVVIPLWRGDVWGDDLVEATKGCFEELGGTMVDGVRYSPTTEDFSTELGSLNSKVSQTIAQYGDVDSLGVYLLAFEEVVPIFIQAQNYPSISTVKWYGNNAVALDKELISNTPAAQFAIRTGFPNPTYAVGKTEKYGLVDDPIRKKIGRPPNNYAFAAYDALWVATLSYLATGRTNDSATLKIALPQTAGSYFGATGWTVLNEAGDRKFGNYDFWAVREDNDTFMWEHVARYQVDPGLPGRLIYERKPVSLEEQVSLKPIKLGHVGDYSSICELYSTSEKKGQLLAIEELNAAGGILGRQLEYLDRDGALNVDISVRELKDLILSEKIDFALGPCSSSEALALQAVTGDYNIIRVSSIACTEAQTVDNYNGTTLQVVVNSYMEGRGQARRIHRDFPNAKKFYCFNQDYEFGYREQAAFEEEIKRLVPDAVIVGKAFSKLGETDYSPFITAMLAMKDDIDFVQSSLYGDDLVAFTKQAKGYGFFDELPFMALYDIDVLRALGKDVPEGVYGFARGDFFADPNPKMMEFVEKYRAKYNGEYPSGWAVLGYDAIYALKAAIKIAGTTDTDAVREALKGMDFTGLRGYTPVRAIDLMMVAPTYNGIITHESPYPFPIWRDVWKIDGAEVIRPEESVLEVRAALSNRTAS